MPTVTAEPAAAGIRSHRAQVSDRLLSGLALAGVLAVALASYANTVLGTDVAWYITICERVLAGDRLYVDIIEVNPPFSVWMYMPAVIAARALSIAPETAVRAMPLLATAGSLWMTRHIIVRTGLLPLPLPWWAGAAAAAALLLGPGHEIAQREHIGLIVLLPLLAVIAARADAGRSPHVPPWIAAIAGVGGMIVLAIKPHYGLAILLPALHAAWRRRSPAPVLAPEMWVAGGLFAVYVACVWWLTPEYVRVWVPILIDVYIPVRLPFGVLAGMALPGWIALLSAIHVLGNRPWSDTRIAAPVLAGAGMLFVYFLMGKGWSYHIYPVFGATGIGLIAALAARPPTVRQRPLIRWAGIAAAGAGVLAMWNQMVVTYTIPPGLIADIRAQGPTPRMMVVGSDNSFGHPVTRIVGGRWVASTAAQWVGRGAMPDLYDERRRVDARTAARLARWRDGDLDRLLRDLEVGRPDILIVVAHDVWTHYALADPRLRAALANFREIGRHDGRAVLARRSEPTGR